MPKWKVNISVGLSQIASNWMLMSGKNGFFGMDNGTSLNIGSSVNILSADDCISELGSSIDSNIKKLALIGPFVRDLVVVRSSIILSGIL